MAKRFTDTEKWKKPFVRGLQGAYKLLWFYILDDCDHAGIWQVDEEVASIRVGQDIDFKEAIRIFGENIIVFDDGQKWFIPNFIEFQYGELNPSNRVHLSIINIHKKYKIKGLTSSLQGAKDKDKDMDKDMDMEKEKGITIFSPAFLKFQDWIKTNCENVSKLKEPFTEKQYQELIQKFDRDQVREVLLAMHNTKDLTKKYVSAYLTCINWIKRRNNDLKTNTNDTRKSTNDINRDVARRAIEKLHSESDIQ